LTADLERLLPHRPPMVLVDGVERADADVCVARWTVPADSPWVADGRLLRAALVEVAAQTAALHAGLAGEASGEPARRGYLGMVSGFRIRADARAGDVLRSSVRRVASFGRLARIECRIERVEYGETTLIADGGLTVALTEPSDA
jgi:3-hydroxymyristoyl/3-hydroxydecanoyl-(acyl carrier protein) dehydratase